MSTENKAREIAEAILKDFDKPEFGLSTTLLPCQLQPQQVGFVRFRATDKWIMCTCLQVHFTLNKVKYDLSLQIDEDQETRIYNVDSAFVTPWTDQKLDDMI